VNKLPWNNNSAGQRDGWESLRFDLIDAYDDGDLDQQQLKHHTDAMVEMFNVGWRSPLHVIAARLCFLHLTTAEA
jgi:hypothetical protein